MISKGEKLHCVAAEDHSEHDFLNAPAASDLRPEHSRGRLSRYGQAAVDVNDKGRLLRGSRSAQYMGWRSTAFHQHVKHIKALFCSSNSFFLTPLLFMPFNSKVLSYDEEGFFFF